jgi:hypothetical protein
MLQALKFCAVENHSSKVMEMPAIEANLEV